MLIYCWWEWQSAQPLWKIIWLYSKIKNTYDLTSLTWECTQYCVLGLTEFKTWTKMLVEPLFIIVQNWVWPRCPSLAKGINCVVFLLSSMKKKKKTIATSNSLNESPRHNIQQKTTQKRKYSTIPFTWSSKIGKINSWWYVILIIAFIFDMGHEGASWNAGDILYLAL